MGFIKILALLLVLIPTTSAAEKIVAEPLGKPAPVKPLSLQDQTQLLCEAYRIMSSYADPTYKEGVDAYGRPVVPADGGADSASRAFSIPEEIQVPVTVDLAKHLSLPLGTELNSQLGTIAVRSNGSVLFNGVDQTNKLSTICKEMPIDKDNKIPGGNIR